MERFFNDPATTLNGSITNSATTLIVTSATGFPTTGNFRILVESELMIVTGVSGTTFTVTRGAESTSAVSHTTGLSVRHVVTGGGLTQGINDVRFPILQSTVPDASALTWVNQGGATLTHNGNNFSLYGPGSASANLRILTVPIPTAPYTYTTIQTFDLTTANSSPALIGMGMYDTSTTKLATIHWEWVNQWRFEVNRWNSPTSYNSTINSTPSWGGPLSYACFKVVNDTTNYNFYYSQNGVAWVLLSTLGVSSWATFNKLCVYVDSENTYDIGTQVLSMTY